MPETSSGALTRHRGWGRVQPCPARFMAVTTPDAFPPVCLPAGGRVPERLPEARLLLLRARPADCSRTGAPADPHQRGARPPGPAPRCGLPGGPGVSVSGLSLGLQRWLVLTKLSHTYAL